MTTGSRAVNRPTSLTSLLSPLVLFTLLALACVIAVPKIIQHYSWTTDVHSIQSAATSFIVILLTANLLLYAGRRMDLPSPWLECALLYNSLIVVIKLIISPSVFNSSIGSVSTRYIYAGIIVMALYLVGLWFIYEVYKRLAQKSAHHKGHVLALHWTTKIIMAAGLLLLAFAARIIVADLLTSASTAAYLKNVFSGNGFVLPILLVSIILLAIESFELAARKGLKTLRQYFFLNTGLIIVYHVLWIAYTLTLFNWR